MFNLGGPEIVVVILVALVVLGPEQLPKAMRTFGSVMGEIRKLSGGFQDEMRDAMKAVEFDGLTKGSGGGSTTSGNATTSNAPAATGVEEVVARNTGPAPASSSGPVEQVNGPPAGEGTTSSAGSDGPSAADRAAG